MIYFFAEKLGPSKTTLNKLLFYADFYNFKNNGFSISGSIYIAHNYGPVPHLFGYIFEYVNNSGIARQIWEDYRNNYSGENFYPEDNFYF